MFNLLFAHAGEDHSTTAEAVAHQLEWFYQIPIFIVSVFIVGYFIWLITKKQDTTVLLTSTILLIAGFACFSVAPIISILSISIGIIATLFVTLVGLGQKPKAK
ncbi:hypothetical protein KBB49_00320 [Candidatus Saccharibacteria bacterium]|nr:hypothetical protein [Candidatus Saccharibacteria bacterium]